MAATRKPQTVWGLRIKDVLGPYIDPYSIRATREGAVAVFWRDRKNYSPQARAFVEKRLDAGTYRFVKVQIIPVEGEDG